MRWLSVKNGSPVKWFISSLLIGSLPMVAAGAQLNTASAQDRGVAPLTSAASSATGDPKYFALVIGISGYQVLPHLQTPISDAKSIEDVLKNQYGFATQLLNDATRDQIIGAMDSYSHSLTVNDELLIYYAGHGYYDENREQAFWAPVEATHENFSHWITAADITGAAKAVPARHVLIISDSCYSGMIPGSGITGTDTGQDPDARATYLQNMEDRLSLHILASGGKEPVLDEDPPDGVYNHSVFANLLLRDLAAPRVETFTAGELALQITQQVGGRSRQLPEYSAIRRSPHDAGDFVFHRLPATGGGPAIVPADLSIRRHDPEKDSIQRTLDKYEDAYNSMDLHILKEVWPSLSGAQEKALRNAEKVPGLKAVKVELRNRQIMRDGDTAKVKCDQWMVYTWQDRRQPPQTNSVEVQLFKNQQGTWQVSNVRVP